MMSGLVCAADETELLEKGTGIGAESLVFPTPEERL